MVGFECDTVVGLRGTDRRDVFALGGSQRWLAGSSSRCDIVIPDPYASAIHCALERRDDGRLVVRDAGSQNGIVVDERQVVAAELRVGSYLTIGRTTLVAMGAPCRAACRAIDPFRRDPVIRAALERATAGHVLIAGEPGTGKRLLARLVHDTSNPSGPLVTMRCAAVPRSLAASELFGADASTGYLAEARGGTLVLDEVDALPGDRLARTLPAEVQQLVRRVLDKTRVDDVRIVATTTADPSRLLELRDRFAVEMALPSLRERASDIQLLVEAMLAEYGDKHVSAQAWRELTAYSWPENLRELHAVVERAVKQGADLLELRDFFPGAHRDRGIVGADVRPSSLRPEFPDGAKRRRSRAGCR